MSAHLRTRASVRVDLLTAALASVSALASSAGQSADLLSSDDALGATIKQFATVRCRHARARARVTRAQAFFATLDAVPDVTFRSLERDFLHTTFGDLPRRLGETTGMCTTALVAAVCVSSVRQQRSKRSSKPASS